MRRTLRGGVDKEEGFRSERETGVGRVYTSTHKTTTTTLQSTRRRRRRRAK